MVPVQILQKSKNISKNMGRQMCKADQHNDQALRNEFDLWLSNRFEDNHQDGRNIFYFFLIYNNFFEMVILGQNGSNWVKMLHPMAAHFGLRPSSFTPLDRSLWTWLVKFNKNDTKRLAPELTRSLLFQMTSCKFVNPYPEMMLSNKDLQNLKNREFQI